MLRSDTKVPVVAAVTAAVVAASLALAACGGSGSPGTTATTATGGGATAQNAPVFTTPRTIDNRYLPLTAHRRCTFRGETKGGAGTGNVLTRTDRTRRFTVAGRPVDVAVFEDKAFEAGRHVETALDYFAQADDGTVFYFGEHVRNLRNGKVVNTDGTWLYGRDTDVLGVAMVPDPEVGDQWHLEDVPGITTESNRVEETGLRTKAAGKVRTGTIRVQEFIQPEGELEYKIYAPGLGTVVSYDPDSRTELVACR